MREKPSRKMKAVDNIGGKRKSGETQQPLYMYSLGATGTDVCLVLSQCDN